ncbi:MAG: N-acetyl-gamma-glutamyl-phosphate reductase [Candidatus Omnitrophota bacterium]|jgi:N-acetyl-gamma-glutamyl-phosphate reductase
MAIDVGIVGATGHTGEELIGILLKHPYVRIAKLYNTSVEPQVISDVFPKFRGRLDLPVKQLNIKEAILNCDLIFLALPHTVSMTITSKLLKAGMRVIDLSADYRLTDVKIYEKFYKAKHQDKTNLKYAVYGLPELYRAKIRDASLVANPGCYPTAAILSLAPLAAFNLIEPDSIIIDAKSGVSGAGKRLEKSLLFSEVYEDFKTYKVNAHQHIPEINQVLSRLSGKRINITFVPHLLPLDRGILETIYVRKIKKIQDILGLYRKFYKKEPFVRIKKEGEFPRIKDVAGTNFCDIGIKDDGNNLVIVSAIDNLIKGASGEAVQNMNIMFKFPESAALL